MMYKVKIYINKNIKGNYKKDDKLVGEASFLVGKGFSRYEIQKILTDTADMAIADSMRKNEKELDVADVKGVN